MQGTSSNKDFENFENRRRYPRITLDSSANLLLPAHLPIKVSLHDISVCALQVRFDAATEKTIRSALQLASGTKESALGIRFRIKIHDVEEHIYVACSPVYICQIGHDLFAMGLKFSDTEGRYQELINKFVEVSMEPL